MKPNEPSRTALIIARQRAAHQVLDHGSILFDPFAMKILREDEKEVRPARISGRMRHNCGLHPISCRSTILVGTGLSMLEVTKA
jgi:O-methyltransferase involved in polyketide biosynthesis